MIFDTDVLVWALRGNPKAAKIIDDCEDRFISAVTYMELIQGARNKAEQKSIKDFLSMLEFRTIPINENISLRATVLMEEFCLKSGMGVADALIFSTANECAMILCSANKKHYREIASLITKEFKP
ncbi:MAG: type II toxin-antitoxin system VapC family toxin [Victivallaceae bacterium]|nr:type II toxin-antitoxin system VapC family toxin [Victivallaceae bacterium]